MRDSTRALLVIVAALAAFHLGRCTSAASADTIFPTAPQPIPREPINDYLPGQQSSIYIEMSDGWRSSHCTAYMESDYTLVTAEHCLDDGRYLTHVTTYDDGRYTREVSKGEVIALDQHDHVKVRTTAKLKGRPAKAAPMPPPGTPIYTVGNPAGVRWLLRVGYVAGTYRSDHAPDRVYDVLELNTWHGDSGGPVYDMQGNVVGLTYAYIPYENKDNNMMWRIVIADPISFTPAQWALR